MENFSELPDSVSIVSIVIGVFLFVFFFFCKWSLGNNLIILFETSNRRAERLSDWLACAVTVMSALFPLNPIHTCSLFQNCGRMNENYNFWEVHFCDFPPKHLQGTCLEAWAVSPQIPDIAVHVWTDTKGVTFRNHMREYCVVRSWLATKSKGDFIVTNFIKVKYNSNIMLCCWGFL